VVVDLVVAWLVFPVVLLSLATGWGCVVTRLCGVRLPGELVPPLGFAAIVVVSGLVTLIPAAAQFATPVVVGGAVAGLVAAWPSARPSRAVAWPVAAATIVLAAYAAPFVLSGTATYAGYLTLDDTSTLFAMTDRMLEHGRTVDGLAPSTYEATLATSLMVGYPMGSLLPLGIGAALVGEDVAWVFQPYLAVIAALLALVLWRLLRAGVPRPWWRLLAVVVAAQPALLYAYGMWTGVKELTAALLVALGAALAFERRGDRRLRSWLPLAMAVAATVGALSVGGIVWLLPLAVWLLVFAVWQLVGATGVLRARDAAAGIAVLLVLALPAIFEARRFIGDGHLSSWTDEERLANLVQALNPVQVFGIWPAGDFRLRPDSFWPVIVLVCLVASLAVAGFVRAILRRDALLGYGACAAAGAIAYWVLASPWIEAKAFAVASPAVLALAASTCAWLATSGRRVEAVIAATLVTGGVLWSNVLAYRDVNLAPRDQLEELEAIGRDFTGQGPALMTEYQPIGVRHFLRGLDAEGASELRRRLVPLRDGRIVPKLQYVNLDAFRLDGILVYRTLVVREPPAGALRAWPPGTVLRGVAAPGGLHPGYEARSARRFDARRRGAGLRLGPPARRVRLDRRSGGPRRRCALAACSRYRPGGVGHRAAARPLFDLAGRVDPRRRRRARRRPARRGRGLSPEHGRPVRRACQRGDRARTTRARAAIRAPLATAGSRRPRLRRRPTRRRPR
jgi:hypothetical protein